MTIPRQAAVTSPARVRCAAYRLKAWLLPILLALGMRAPALSSAHYADEKPEKPYALIYGTVFGPDNHSVYGIRVKIRRADQKKAKWELYSDHAGEFAQRVPAGRYDYVVWADLKSCKAPECKKLQGGTEVTVRIQNDERADISLHLK